MKIFQIVYTVICVCYLVFIVCDIIRRRKQRKHELSRLSDEKQVLMSVMVRELCGIIPDSCFTDEFIKRLDEKMRKALEEYRKCQR